MPDRISRFLRNEILGSKAFWHGQCDRIMPNALALRKRAPKPEPLGSVVYESMSRGKGAIVRSIGGTTELIIDGQTGLLVPPGDVDALVKAKQKLIENQDLRARIGDAARERAIMHLVEVSVPRFEGLYQQIVAQPKGSDLELNSVSLI